MSTSNEKKRARDLQAITGMPYQSALRAVASGTEHEASVRSGYGISDFVTPREIRIWLHVNSNDLRCAEGAHWMWTEELGQCVGCGVPMAVDRDDEGQEYTHLIGEDEFLRRCVEVEMYYNWAPPMSALDGITQYEYFRRYWHRTWVEDESLVPVAGADDPWVVASGEMLSGGLSPAHWDLL